MLNRASLSLKKRNFVFFSPHFDDVVISCGGFIRAMIEANQAVTVITIFAAETENPSAFARHLYADWKLMSAQHERAHEDERALHSLGVQFFQHWDYQEAPIRRNQANQPLYASYEELTGGIADEDHALIERIAGAIQTAFALDHATILYFPLSIGNHIDHQIMYRVGLMLNRLHYRVRFYEDWPYVDGYARTAARGWHCQRVPISLEKKIGAALEYTSQLNTMGGSRQIVSERLKANARRSGEPNDTETFWALPRSYTAVLPYAKTSATPSIRDFRKFLDTFHFSRLGDLLPVGNGRCFDVGCGGGRLRTLIESKGYDWLGMEFTITINEQTIARPDLQADCQYLPIRAESAATVVSWGVIEFAIQPEVAFAEAARVLEKGGVFCGYVSFLEPTQGSSLYGMSPLLVRELLRKYGFKDIQVQSGLNGFAITLWTWLRRWGGAGVGRMAIPLTVLWMVPLAALRFYVSWFNFRFGKGTGHGMRWVTETSLNEFAGYVTFVARKPAQSEAYQQDIPLPGVFFAH